MPVIQKQIAVAAGDVVENALSGSAFEFARGNQLVSMGVTQSVDGGFITIQSGSDIVLEESEPAVDGDFPTIPDTMYYNDVATAGDRLVIRLRNPSGGTITFNVLVQITAV